MLLFKYRIVSLFIFSCFWIRAFCMMPVHQTLNTYSGYAIQPKAGDEKSNKWNNYFYHHLQRRADSSDRVIYNRTVSGYFNLSVKLDPSLSVDFSLKVNRVSAQLAARNESALVWIIYQVIKCISDQDPRIKASDLNPTLIHFTDTVADFAFSYRSLYSPVTCLDKEVCPLLGISDLDTDWGIWGHGLSKVFGKEAPEAVYSTVDGRKNYDQYCFSSQETYHRIEQYIVNQYGEHAKQTLRFAIMPADNMLVCTCPTCRAIGNTPVSATPAVSKLVTRLAKRFPEYQFFTSTYLTTKELPQKPLPVNAGIIVSAIDFPLKNGNKACVFSEILNHCRTITHNIIVWDYINNFDDYLTPFPILNIMKQRLQLYRKCGVSGVFLNGSGYDYASFSDVQAYVLSALMINPDVSVEDLVKRYFKQYYSFTADLLSDFYLGLEQKAEHAVVLLPLYGGIVEAEKSYLDAHQFIDFYNSLKTMIDIVPDDERILLNRLLISLSFTRLELARSAAASTYGLTTQETSHRVISPQVTMSINQLSRYTEVPSLQRYRETGGSIGIYLDDWKRVVLPSLDIPNLLFAQKIEPLNPLDEDYQDLGILCDGVAGLPDNYHCGWVLFSQGNFELAFSAKPLRAAKHIRLTFLYDPGNHLEIPLGIELYKNGTLYKRLIQQTAILQTEKSATQVIPFENEVDLDDATSLKIRILQSKGKKLAMDEIRFIP